jgi:tetratricopeptide (TPR) repeat protein
VGDDIVKRLKKMAFCHHTSLVGLLFIDFSRSFVIIAKNRFCMEKNSQASALLSQIEFLISKNMSTQALELFQISTLSNMLDEDGIQKSAQLFMQKRLLHEAVIALRIAVHKHKSLEIYTLLSIALKNIGRIDEALKVVDSAFELGSSPMLFRSLADIFTSRGELKNATKTLIKATQTHKNEPKLYSDLSLIYQKSGDTKQAVKALEEGIKNTNAISLWIELGNLMYTISNYKNAETLYQKALELEPSSTQALVNLGVIKKELQKYDEAESLYKKALNINPKDAAARNNMGVLYKTTKNFKSAIKNLREAISINPNHADAYSNIGAVLKETNKPNWAIPMYTKALKLNPNHINASLDLGIILMSLGRYKEGLRLYEARLRTKELAGKQAGLKKGHAYKKGEEIEGKRVLVYGEQGFGDALQFVRYLQELKKRGAEVILRTRSELKSLLESSSLATSVIVEGESLEYDVHMALLSLPYLLDIEPMSFKSEFPYLHTKKSSYSKKKKNLIVFAFGGSPTHKAHKERFIDPKHFEFLTKLVDSEIVSLQLGGDRELLKECSFYEKIVDFAENIEDFSDSAALLKSADVLITSDTSVAHLGGALGAKTYVLLPTNPDWRWGRSGSESFWYPSIRLFRQECKYRWEGVIEEVKECLQKR